MEEHKVVILGSGIAGMTAGIYLKRGGLDVLVVEDNIPGGVLNEIPSIENYPGYEEISGPDLAMNIYNQLTKLGVKILNKKITSIDLNNKIINNNIKYEYLVIATGRKSRMLSLEHEKELLGKGISTCALCDGFFYKDKKVAVVGGGSSSLTEALYLSKICKEVIIIHRRDKLTADKYLIDKVNSTKNIKVLYNSNITKYNQNNNKLTSVTINNKDNLEVEGVFLAIGSTPNSEIFNVNKDNNYIIVDSNYMTNIDKVYAIGDVIKKDYYQLSTAASDAVVVASNIIKRENKNS
ncbi:MAG: FAD-dependent oxidoreductase [Candidatus Gastranaerophilaceae bacterium]|jgi:thioredoxin-disulfide reductase